MRLHRDNHAVRRTQCVQRQHTQRGHTVDEGIVVTILHGGQKLPHDRFTAHGIDQRDLQRRQLDICRQQINAGIVMQDTLSGTDWLVGDDLAHQVGQGGGKLVRLGPSQHLRQVPLGVCVHQKDFFTLPRKTNGKAGGCGSLADAAFLVCKGDSFHFKHLQQKRSLPAPSFTQQLFYSRRVFFLTLSVLLYSV